MIKKALELARAFMHPAGIEPALPESESGVLSIRLRLQSPTYNNTQYRKSQMIAKISFAIFCGDLPSVIISFVLASS